MPKLDLWKPDQASELALKRGKRKMRRFFRSVALTNANSKAKRLCVTCRKRFKPEQPSHMVCPKCYSKAKQRFSTL